MQDKIFVYMDFILTMQRLTVILQNLAIKACQELNPTISGEQILYLYHFLLNPTLDDISDKKYNRKNFYYTLKKLSKEGYIKLNINGRHITSIEATPSGQAIVTQIENMCNNQFKQLLFHGMNTSELSHVLTLVYRFEKFWMHLLNNRISL